MMFVSNVHGKEAINALADSIGCKAGECVQKSGYGRPGLTGNTFGIKDRLKSAGAKWDGDNKAWIFESWEVLEKALFSVTNK